ncbi:MAG: hypothetical protein MUF64_02535 [Polyangiaceae bacterium]|nr:hypothetical protein [Polyangiaceae bacterium]
MSDSLLSPLSYPWRDAPPEELLRLRRHLLRSQSFLFVILVCNSPRASFLAADWLRQELPASKSLVYLDGYYHRNYPENREGILEKILAPMVAQTASSKTYYLDATRGLPEHRDAWINYFQRLNELRNNISSELQGSFVLALSPRMLLLFASFSPDFWSIRSAQFSLNLPSLPMPTWHARTFAIIVHQNALIAAGGEERLREETTSIYLKARKLLGTSGPSMEGGLPASSDLDPESLLATVRADRSASWLDLLGVLLLLELQLRKETGDYLLYYETLWGYLDSIRDGALHGTPGKYNHNQLLYLILRSGLLALERAQLPVRWEAPINNHPQLLPLASGDGSLDAHILACWCFYQRHRAELSDALGDREEATEAWSALWTGLAALKAHSEAADLRDLLGEGIDGLGQILEKVGE